MERTQSISVAMASYNGEKYIKAQLDSMILQMGPEDEIVISLDPSTDRTEAIIKEYCEKDERVRLVSGPGKGVKMNFENAISQCKNEIIFLADQDDVWEDTKLNHVCKVFDDPEVDLVMHDAVVVDGELNTLEKSFFEMNHSRKGFMNNILKNSYIGCCMAFRKKCLLWVLPFPSDLPMHDQWIGLICEKKGKVCFLNKPLLKYRRHGENVSQTEHSSVKQMLVWRLRLIKDLIARLIFKK